MKINNEDAVSPILGTLMLLMISIVLFSILFSFVSGLEPSNKGPSSLILAYSEDNKIIINHYGGESIDVRSNLILYDDNDPLILEIGDYMAESDKEDGFWNIGEYIIYKDYEVLFFEESSSDDIRFSIVDYFEKSVIVNGNLKI